MSCNIVVTLRAVAAAVACGVLILVGAVNAVGAPPKVQARIAVPGQPIGVAYAEGSAWVASFERNAVVRIDQTTNSVVAEVPVGIGPIGVTSGAGSVWVADWRGGTVTRVDPAANRAIATIPVGGPEGPEGMAFGAGSVWVVNSGDGTVSRVAVG